MDKNSKKKETMHVAPRLHSFGGTLDCILHSIILSTNLDIKINFLFVKDHTKIILDKSINHNKLLNFFKFEDINFEKNFIIKLKKKLFVSLKNFILFKNFVKIFFFLKKLNLVKIKKNFKSFYDYPDYFDGVKNEKNFLYLKNLTKNRSINNYQEMYFNRKPFQLNNELKKLSNDLLVNYNLEENNYSCLYLREKIFDNKFIHLNKKRSKVFYELSDLFKLLNYSKTSEYNLVKIKNLINNKSDLEIKKNKFFLDLNNEKEISYMHEFCFASKCSFFISTGGGKSEIARIFNKPILRIDHEYNVLRNSSMSTRFDQIILPHVYSKEKKRFLSLKEQFENLDSIFPEVGRSSKFEINDYFNNDLYICIKNTQEEILELFKGFSKDINLVNEIREDQKKLFDIKKFNLSNHLSHEFIMSTEFYPENPLISEKFFNKYYEYSDDLEEKTNLYNSKKLFG